MDSTRATEEIVRKYQSRIYRLALSITRNEKDAEDVLQNTLLKIFKNIENFKNQSKLFTWIYRITYNEALMYLRKRRRLFNSSNAFKNYIERMPAGFFVNWSRLPDEHLLDAELKERIDAALKTIPIHYRMPLILHRIEGLSLRESSQILGLKTNSLKTRLHRAYCLIKQEINDYFKDRVAKEHPGSPKCGIWTRFIYDYAEGKLNRQKQASFRRHIQDCYPCTTFLNGYLKAIRITKALECEDVPAQLQKKIETFVSRSKK